MKIAICAMGELFGGVERQILDLCRYQVREGLAPPLVILFHDHTLATRLREQGIEPLVVRGRSRYDWSLIGRVGDLLTAAGVDVVHVHGYKATIVCGLATRRTGCRVIKTEHGKVEAAFARPLAWFKSQLNFRCEQWVTRRQVDHVCYVTEDIARSYDKGHQGLIRSVVHNGIDPLRRQDHRRPVDLPQDTFNVGIVGRISAVKGIPFAVEALGRDGVPPEVHLHVIGGGPLEAEITRQVAAAGLGDRVHLPGFRENIFDYLAHLDLLLMPSLHEGLPYTLLEAWSLGCPLAVSRVGGLAEVLEEGPGITLFPVGDVAAIAAAMTAAYGAAVHGRPVLVPCPHTLDDMGRRYLDIMEEAVGRTTP